MPPRPPRLPPSAVTAELSWPQYLLQIQASSLSSSQASSSSSASGSDTESWCASHAHLDAIMLGLYCVCPGVCDLSNMRCCVDPATATSRMQTDCCISFTASIEQLSLGYRTAWHLVHLACIGDHGQCVGHPGAAWRQGRHGGRGGSGSGGDAQRCPASRKPCPKGVRFSFWTACGQAPQSSWARRPGRSCGLRVSAGRPGQAAAAARPASQRHDGCSARGGVEGAVWRPPNSAPRAAAAHAAATLNPKP